MENLSFDQLNQIIRERKTDTPQDVLSTAISKGLYVVELYLLKLSRQYGIAFSSEDIYEVVTQVLDNILKYYDISKNSDLKAYMIMTAHGKYLNYFRDNLKDKKFTSLDEPFNNNSDTTPLHLLKSSENSSIDTETKLVIREAFSLLGDKCQKSLYYKKVLNYTVKDIMALLNIKNMTESNVRKAISNCLKTLKDLIFTKNGGL